jgi:hypothetical protein
MLDSDWDYAAAPPQQVSMAVRSFVIEPSREQTGLLRFFFCEKVN